MDELDLLLDSMDSTAEGGVTFEKNDLNPQEMAALALEEFSSAGSAEDRLEALKLLIALAGKK